MACSACGADNPEVASFCHKCGHGLRGSDAGKRDTYVVQSAESVTQFALISTIMPHTSRRSADNFRWALLVAGGLVLAFTFAGLLPAAVVAGAALVPVVYLVYIYEVNLWEDAPLRTVLVVFALTGILATLVTLVFFDWVFDGRFVQLVAGRGGVGSVPILSLLIFAVALPIVAEVVKNLPGLYLASRPAYDDMIDGLTFGVAAGTAYAAFETIVEFRSVFSGPLQVSGDVGTYLVTIINLMIVKSVVYGTATGIAMATYSGRGEGYDGFTPQYFANFAFAAGMNVLYWLGQRLLAYAPAGRELGLLWGIIVAAVLVIRVRVLLQAALLEAAVEDAANEHRSRAATTEGGFCPECELQLLPDAMFCIVCGVSVRATSNQARRQVTESVTGGVA